jgi:hypothetical protein
MMMTEMDIETLVYYVHLTQLIAREDFIKSVGFILIYFDECSIGAVFGLSEMRRGSFTYTSQQDYWKKLNFWGEIMVGDETWISLTTPKITTKFSKTNRE